MTGLEQDIVMQALRVVFLIGFPIVIGVAIIGTIVSALQSATTMDEPSVAYAARLITVVVLLYKLAPLAADSIATLAEMALK